MIYRLFYVRKRYDAAGAGGTIGFCPFLDLDLDIFLALFHQRHLLNHSVSALLEDTKIHTACHATHIDIDTIGSGILVRVVDDCFYMLTENVINFQTNDAGFR